MGLLAGWRRGWGVGQRTALKAEVVDELRGQAGA